MGLEREGFWSEKVRDPPKATVTCGFDMAAGQNHLGINHFGGLVNSPPILEPILVVGLVDV